jgi:succinyl-CoA synthetase beta subunit
MNIHEYQAKSLLAKFGVAVPRGAVAYTPEEAENAARELGGPIWVVKSQIHAGGRGAGRFADDPDGPGGVRLCKSLDDVKDNARKMLGHVLVTRQTGAQGKSVKRLYIEEGCDIARELYLGMLIDRATSRITIMASTEEEVAAATPEKILKVVVDPAVGLMPFHGRQIAFGLGLDGKAVGTAVKFLMAMYRAFIELDASIVEVNPLVITGDGGVLALDAKMNFDDNALFRHKEPTCATRTRKTPWSWRPRATSSTTSSSTAPSAAWSTAPAWPWRPWTSSSSMAASRPTSWMWAAAPPRNG